MPNVEIQEAWIGAAISAATAIAGAIMKSRSAHDAAKSTQKDLDQQKAEATALYNRRFYEDGTQRADVSRALTNAGERLRRQNQAVAGTSAVMGGTNAQSAAQKEANNEAYANMVSQAAASAEARKDAVEDRYNATLNNLHTQQRAMTNQRSAEQQQAITDATGQVVNVANAYEAGNYKKD